MVKYIENLITKSAWKMMNFEDLVMDTFPVYVVFFYSWLLLLCFYFLCNVTRAGLNLVGGARWDLRVQPYHYFYFFSLRFFFYYYYYKPF